MDKEKVKKILTKASDIEKNQAIGIAKGFLSIDDGISVVTDKIDKISAEIKKDSFLEVLKQEFKGEQGDQGIQGEKGVDGQDGADGKDGKDGADGKNGNNGKDGADGTNGSDGLDGLNGNNGSPDTRLQIIEKINSGGKDDVKIQAIQVVGFEKTKKDLDFALSVLDQRTQFLINKSVKHDSTLSGSGTDADPLSVLSAGGGTTSPLTTKGDLYAYSITNARLAVGTDGFVLSADSTQTTGLKWIAVAGTGTVTSVASANSSITVTNPTTTVDLALNMAHANTWTGLQTFSPTLRTSGVAAYLTINAPADTGITANTEGLGINVVGATRTFADGTVAVQREYLFRAPTYNKTTTALTLTESGTVVITGPPISGTGVTQTNPYALWVQSGVVHFGGQLGGTTQASIGGTGAEFADSNNTTGGQMIDNTNTNAGTSAFCGYGLYNDLANDNTFTHYSGMFYNSSGFTDTSFGTAFAIANQLSLYGTDGPTLIGTIKAGSYMNVQIGGAALANEVARFTAAGMTVGLTGTLTGAINFAGATSTFITLQGQAVGSSSVLTLPAATDTLIGKATTDIFTNKTYDTAGSGNVLKINGTTVSAVTGSGSVVLATSPALTGSPTAPTQTQGDNSTKLATTAYVDLAVLGQNFKEACRVATTGNLVGTYLAGVFTYTATGTDSIDGVTLVLNDRVLVKNQSDNTQNGIYKVTTAGALGIAGILTRATDANQSSEFKTGDSVFITAGTTLSTTTWAYTGIDSPTIGSDAITYVQVAGQGSFTAGNGITITGVSIAIDTSITVDKTTVQTLTNKTLTSSTNVLGGVTMALGSDAVGDIYATTTSNVLSRIAAVATGQVLVSKGTTTLPAYSADPTLNTLSLSATTNQLILHSASNATTITAPSTAARTITLPDATGTLPIIIASSGTASSTTNSSTEVNLAVVTIPAGIMGTNGHIVINVMYKFVGTVGTKTPTVRHSTTSGDTSAGTVLAGNIASINTVLSVNMFNIGFYNSNSASAQIFGVQIAGGEVVGGSGTAFPTGAINTANASYINFNALTANSGDTAQVVGYTVAFYPAV